MYQVFVVEDELLIRQNIRRLLEKIGSPFSFCGEASDGEMALSIIQDVMPDILLTDIRMPFLDGFDLIKHAKAIMPWLKVVIISGFDEFEYARKAITLGVNSYLLKPVNAQDLEKELCKIADDIEAEKNKPKAAGAWNEDEIGFVMRQNYIKQLFSGFVDTSMLLDKAGALKLDIVRTHYQVAQIAFDCDEGGRRALNDALISLLVKQEINTFLLGPSGNLSVLFCDNGTQALSDSVFRFISILKHEMAAYANTITVVTSPVATRLSMISGIYQTAGDLLTKAQLMSPGQVVDASDTAQLALGYLSINEPFGEDFRRRLANAAPAEIGELLDSALKGPNAVKLDSAITRFYALLGILRSAAAVICGTGGDIKDTVAQLNSEVDISLASYDRNDFRPAAIKLMTLAATGKGERIASNKHYHVINRAVAYVQANFCDPNITLISVANHVGMSTAHFSTVFSQAMGRSFINYVTMLRIEKAKELLVKTDMKLSDVAMEIGYNEPNYFSHVFRKSEGVTPKDYRNSPK